MEKGRRRDEGEIKEKERRERRKKDGRKYKSWCLVSGLGKIIR